MLPRIAKLRKEGYEIFYVEKGENSLIVTLRNPTLKKDLEYVVTYDEIHKEKHWVKYLKKLKKLLLRCKII